MNTVKLSETASTPLIDSCLDVHTHSRSGESHLLLLLYGFDVRRDTVQLLYVSFRISGYTGHILCNILINAVFLESACPKCLSKVDSLEPGWKESLKYWHACKLTSRLLF